MTITYRVLYPTPSQDWQRDFSTRKEAEQFARDRRSIIADSPLFAGYSWNRVEVIEIAT